MARGDAAGREPGRGADPYRVRYAAGRRPRVYEHTLGREVRDACRDARPTDRLVALLALAVDAAVVEGCVMWLRSRRGPAGGSLVLQTSPRLDFVPLMIFLLLAAAAAVSAIAVLAARLPRTALLQAVAAVALLAVAVTFRPHEHAVHYHGPAPMPYVRETAAPFSYYVAALARSAAPSVRR